MTEVHYEMGAHSYGQCMVSREVESGLKWHSMQNRRIR